MKKIIAIIIIVSQICSCTGYKTLYKVGNEKKTQTEYADSIRVRIRYQYSDKDKFAWGRIASQNTSSMTLYGRRFFPLTRKSTTILRSDILKVAQYDKGKGEMKTFVLITPLLAAILVILKMWSDGEFDMSGLGGWNLQ